MIDLLIKLLIPILTSMGVSEADANNYINLIGSYIYILVGSLIVMVIVMIVAHFVVKKGTRHVVRWSAGVAWILLVLVVVNIICYGPLYANVSGALNASKAQISDDVVGNSKAVIQKTGEEGMVLVKNNGILPLSSETTNLNVFGWASTNPIYGGTGSGSSDGSTAISILQSLSDAGYSTNEDISKLYTNYCTTRPVVNMNTQDWTLPEPTVNYYTEGIIKSAIQFSDTAVIVIGRGGGENADLPTDMNAVIKGTWNVANTGKVYESSVGNYTYTNGSYTNNGDYDDFDPGEHYLQLSNTEEAMVDKVCNSFDNVIVVVNANNAMELNWVDQYDSIGAVILAPGTGATGMQALGKILNGTINPSGKTVDTYVKDLTKTPVWNNFGNFTYNNVDSLRATLAKKDISYQGVISFVDYSEGIYTGYKYYETASDDGIINYDEYVQYPFGYGLSYTTFSQEITRLKQGKDTVSIEIKVTNTGTVAGKDVVELYFTPPYANGGIEKSSVNLIDFAKTSQLEPGTSETVKFEIPLEDMASYDSSCIKTENGGYILEAGEYVMSIRSDSHSVLDKETFSIDSDIDYSQDGRESDGTVAVNQFGYAEGDVEYLSRANGFANYNTATEAPSEDDYMLDDQEQEKIKENSVLAYNPKSYDVSENIMPTTGAVNGFALADLAGKTYDDASWDKLLDQMSVEDMSNLINTGGWQTVEIKSVGKIATSDCDGPAGLNNFITGTTGTAFPTEVLMAQTWSKEIAAELGDALGQEFANAKNFGWYGPAMNLHRSAFSGRNFEYYSEDGVLSGIFASYEVNSASVYGVYPYIKHFAANDQETNRCAFLLTYLNEQSLRENILKPFEIVVKNFNYDNGVLAVMSSFNWLGTEPACSSYELLTTVLRDEWSFVGMVITDYNGSYGFMLSDACVRAGNDLMLGFGQAETNKFTDTDSATCVLAMRQASKNILYTVGNSGYYADFAEQDRGPSNMTKTFIAIDAAVVILLVAIEIIILLRWKRKKMKLQIEIIEITE
ncbi:MAG TPA: beta-glucosidase [Clostridiales bacterium]|nr:beta-glucosidase [Clostridiales bacterium]